MADAPQEALTSMAEVNLKVSPLKVHLHARQLRALQEWVPRRWPQLLGLPPMSLLTWLVKACGLVKAWWLVEGWLMIIDTISSTVRAPLRV